MIENILTLTLLQCLALISPGPDFAIVLRHSIQNGKKQGLYAAFGITTGVVVHALYSALGFAQFITKYKSLYWAIKLLAFLYLFRLSFNLIYSSKDLELAISQEIKIKARQAFKEGLLTNILNPKCIIFFLSIFCVAIEPQTPVFVLFIKIAMVFSTTLIWFTFVALMLSTQKIRKIYFKHYKKTNKIIGCLLIFFAFKLLVD